MLREVLGLPALLLVAGWTLAGCNTAPDLNKNQAQGLIQTRYDQTPPAGVNIRVDDGGMGQGALAKLWNRTTVYPNHYWSDFQLTPEGKRAVKLPDGGDLIRWRPSAGVDPHYAVNMTAITTSHMRARDLGEIEDEMLPGNDNAKGVNYFEVVDLTGAPDAVQQIAHRPGNQLSVRRHADFVLENGAWRLHSIH